MPKQDLLIRELLKAYAYNGLTAEQTEVLFNWIGQHPEESEELLREFADSHGEQIFDASPLNATLSKRMQENIFSRINPAPSISIQKRSNKWLKWSAAAAMLVLVSTIAYTLLDSQPTKKITPAIVSIQHPQKDALPAIDGAVLTTATGLQIILDSAANGIVSKEKNIHIVKQDNQLVYNKFSNAIPLPEAYNTLSTLKGRKFQLVLSDGTKVWLDAASELTYPVSFSGNERRVSAKGQLYFEVTKDAARPFIVEAGGTTVQVLGTHFNVNAYEDESSSRTTLLEGSVKISDSNQSLLLKPGQQAVTNIEANEMVLKNEVDLEAVMAWKSGLFQFKNADLSTVLRQLARWYDMEIIYEGTIPHRKFEGKIGRDLNLSQVLKLLEKVRVKFRIEGKQLIVESE